MTVKENTSSESATDFFDVIDVISWCWQAKLWIVSTMIIGLVSGLTWSYFRRPPQFVTNVPVQIETGKSLSPESLEAKFNELLGTKDARSGFESIFSAKMLTSPAIRLFANNTGSYIEIRSLTSDPTGELAFNATNLLHSVAKNLNQKIHQDHKSTHSPDARPTSPDEQRLANLIAAQILEEAPIKERIFAIESKLAEQAGPRAIPVARIQFNVVGDDVLRLLGILGAKIPPNERDKIVDEFAALSGKIRAIQAKYEKPLRDLTAGLNALSQSLIDNSSGESSLYPVVMLQEDSYRAAVTGKTHERSENKVKLYSMLGVMIGAVLGMVGFAIKNYLANNLNRLRRIFFR